MKKTLFWVITLFVVAASLVLAYTLPSIEEVEDDALGGPRSFIFHYGFTVENVPSDSRTVKAWIPVPQTDDHQTVGAIQVSDGLSYEIVNETEHGNRFVLLDLPNGENTRGSIETVVSYRVDRIPNRTISANGHFPKPSNGELARYLRPNQLIPLEGAIALEAKQVAGTRTDPLAQARALYDNIVATVRYDKSGSGWGRGDAVYACDERAGNCTDFHSLFIAEARSLGIPARFVMGFPIPKDAPEGTVGGYHCWAEFYAECHGWVPVDASEAHKHSSKHEAFFGGLDADRVAVTLGRDITIPGTHGEPFNYVIYPHVEIDGKRHHAVTTRFSYKPAPSG